MEQSLLNHNVGRAVQREGDRRDSNPASACAWPSPAEYAKVRLETIFPQLSEQERTILGDIENIRHEFLRAMRFSREPMSDVFKKVNDNCIACLEDAFVELKSRLCRDGFFSKLTDEQQRFVKRAFLEIEFEGENP